MNLTVLATAHAVSESIMRGVSAELARKATPQAYGASGRAAAPSAAAPATVDAQSRAVAFEQFVAVDECVASSSNSRVRRGR